MTFFFYVFIVKTVGKGHGLTVRPLFLIGVWHINQNRRAWLRWLYIVLGGSDWQNSICKVVILLRLCSLEQCLDPVFQTSIKTHNFVTFFKFLIHVGMHHTKSDFTKQLLLALSSRSITCKHEQKEISLQVMMPFQKHPLMILCSLLL